MIVMTLRSLIEGASDVVFRFENSKLGRIPKSRKNDRSKTQFMYLYLGERNNSRSFPKLETTLLSVLEEKIKVPTEDSSFTHDLLQCFRFIQDFGQIDTDAPQLFYELLCCLFNSTDQVNLQRRLFDVLDDCVKISDRYTNISSGSVAEGVDVPGSDYDLMTILEKITVDIDGCHIDEEGPILLYNTNNSYPGFAHLLISKSQYSNDIFHHWGERSIWGTLVSNRRFKEYFIKRYRDTDTTIHGPCISSENGNVDHLFCFRSLSWLPVAEHWIKRARSKEWPSPEVFSEVINEGILFVPIGSKFGSANDYPLEWRVSFSLAEKKLIHSFNHTQLLLYKIYKYIKPFLKDKIFCSYVLKTTLFWMCEETSQEMWIPQNFVIVFREFQRRLLYWTRYEFCPHFFIPDNNLYEGVIHRQTKPKLEFLIKNILSRIFQSKYYASVIYHLTINQFYLRVKAANSFKEKMQTVLGSLRFFRLTYQTCTKRQIDSIMQKSLYRLLTSKLSYFPKGLYLASFCFSNQISPQLTRWVAQTNKEAYRIRKEILSNLLIGNYADAANGWLLISQFFCESGQYHFAISTLKLAEEKGAQEEIVSLANFLYTSDYIDRPLKNVSSKIYLLTYMRSFCLDYVYMLPDPAWLPRELSEDIGFQFKVIPPLVFLHFVRFVCFARQGDTKQRDFALQDLIRYVRSGKYIEHASARAIAYAVLAKAYLSIKDTKAAEYWIQHVKRFCNDNWRWSNVASWNN